MKQFPVDSSNGSSTGSLTLLTRLLVWWISTVGVAALSGQLSAGLKTCTTYQGSSVRGLRSAVCDPARSHALSLQHTSVMYHAPQWSPDGRWILASGTVDGDAELFLIPVAGGAAKKLTDNNAADDLAIWIDGGRRILFESDRRGKMERFVMNADGSDARPAESERAPSPTSPDGRYELHEEKGAIVLVDRTSKARKGITSGLWSEQPSFSPDGRSIVYEQRSSADPHAVETSNIVVARADGTAARAITPGTDPSWSPDGQRLVFKVWEASTQKLFITTAKPDGSDLRRLSDGVHPQWSPDGRRIAFMRDQADGTHIYVMKADGTDTRCLTCSVVRRPSSVVRRPSSVACPPKRSRRRAKAGRAIVRPHKDGRMTTVVNEGANPLTIELRGGGAARLFGLPFLAIGLYLGYHLVLSLYYVVTGQVPITDVLIGTPLLVFFTAAFLVPGWLLMFSRGRVEIDRVARTVDYVRDLRVYQHRARHKLADFDRIEVDMVRSSSNQSKARVYKAELAGGRPAKVTVGLFDTATEALAGAQRLGGMLGLPVKDLCDVEREED